MISEKSMRKIAIILAIFICLTGLMMFRKGLLQKEKIENLLENFFQIRKENSDDSSSSMKREVFPEEEKIIKALENIEKKKEMINEKEQKLTRMEEHLLLQEKELGKKADELLALKNEIESYLRKSEVERSNRIKWLAQVYEKMRPEEVAPIIEKLEGGLALEILSQMDQRQVGRILEAMKIESAVKLAQKLGEKFPGENKNK